MRLRSIKLAGFKSFAEPTNFQLPGQLVGVVGREGRVEPGALEQAADVAELRAGGIQIFSLALSQLSYRGKKR